jgi:hypothetical protein
MLRGWLRRRLGALIRIFPIVFIQRTLLRRFRHRYIRFFAVHFALSLRPTQAVFHHYQARPFRNRYLECCKHKRLTF